MDMDIFQNVKKNPGGGCMHLPMKGGAVDYKMFSRMVDRFPETGFN